jgi:hypothetical protein
VIESHFGLNQSHPWTKGETAYFGYSILFASLGFTLIYWAVLEPSSATLCDPYSVPPCSRRIPDPGFITPGAMFPLVTLLLLAANAPFSPVKRLHAFVQYLVCVTAVLGLLVYRHQSPYDHEYQGVFQWILACPIYGGLAFLVFRVNWWFYWDYPSRRSVAERAIWAILCTMLAPIGVAMGFYRLLGVGNNGATTEFLFEETTPSTFLEAIPEDPALAVHARRIEAIRSARAGTGTGRVFASEKDAVSGSI